MSAEVSGSVILAAMSASAPAAVHQQLQELFLVGEYEIQEKITFFKISLLLPD